MRVFVINLESEVKRLAAVTEQCSKNNLPHEVIRAIDGRKLQQNLLATVVDDYQGSSLTKGEIGCALSHMSVYARMISENIPYALILEDDAVLDHDIHSYLNGIERTINNSVPEIFLLTANCSFNKFIKKTDSFGHQYFRVVNGSGGHGYVINLLAAKRLLTANMPVVFEADRWTIFRDLTGLKVWCSPEQVIKSCCTTSDTSTIGFERDLIAKYRGCVINKRKKSIPYYQLKRIKNALLKKLGTNAN